MNISVSREAAHAASAPIRAPSKPEAIHAAALQIVICLDGGRRVDSIALRAAMEHAFGGSDADGAWDWKSAYEACEAATVLFLRKLAPALRARAPSPSAQLAILTKIAALLPTHTRRSAESQALQQFSTPIALGLAACSAAALTSDDLVLEPSAGTGLLAILAELKGASLCLNEYAETRADLLALLFPATRVHRFDAAQIHDRLDMAIAPSVVLMNPPFSALAHVDRVMPDAAYRHIASALARLRRLRPPRNHGRHASHGDRQDPRRRSPGVRGVIRLGARRGRLACFGRGTCSAAPPPLEKRSLGAQRRPDVAADRAKSHFRLFEAARSRRVEGRQRHARRRSRLRDHRLEPRRQRAHKRALRRISAAIGLHLQRAAPSHPSRAIRRHGVGGAAEADVSS